MADVTDKDVEGFIKRWERSGAAERANYQLFLSELCDIIGVPRPEPATPDNSANAYVFERPITFHHGDGSTSPGYMDLYRRGCYVLEADQVRSLHACLVEAGRPLSAVELAGMFMRAPGGKVEEVLEALVVVGKARKVSACRYVAG
jgi:hypothetical protein